METLVPLVVGFVLTTVLGGLLGSYLQRRSWDHQNEARLREDELRRAGDVCQSVSGLLDKRRYRMLRLSFAVRGHAAETVSAEALTERFGDYDQVLYEWNDSLNVNLAMVGTYFGQHARDLLERAYEIYQQVGSQLEDAYRKVAHGGQRAALDGLDGLLGELDDTAYQLNVFMMTRLREGAVGRRAPRPLEPPPPGRDG
jgi:hypothetical protein